MKKIVKLELCNITPFKNHPFKVRQDDSFIELKDSIRMNGLLEPLLVRSDNAGGYELISGHRRKLALELCGIKEADCYIEELSGGQQQRVSIARAVILNPSIIFADEPIGNLDSKSGKEVMELFKKINEEEHITILQVTHSEESAKYGNRIIRLKDGKIV